MTSSLLSTIVAATAKSVREREIRVPQSVLEQRLPQQATARLATALTAGAGPRIIAECKRRSPSKGVLRPSYDPAAIASSYAGAGAAAISVLTEPTFFDGSLDHLSAVRAAVETPILRKDFIVSRYQIVEGRAAGADAVLLIVAALEQAVLEQLLEDAREIGVDALVEVHDGEELSRALDAGAAIAGVNSRNLHTLQVDTGIFERLAPRLPRGVVAVAESGIKDGATIRTLQAMGYRGFLIGERFMAADDPGQALAAVMRDCGR